MASERTIIATDRAPQAVGPYSQAVRVGGLVFTAGQIPIDPSTGKVEETSIEAQTHQVLHNLSAVLEAAGSGLDKALKLTVFMTDLSRFQDMNAVYAGYFGSDPPARSAVEVAALPLGVAIEMEAVALVE